MTRASTLVVALLVTGLIGTACSGVEPTTTDASPAVTAAPTEAVVEPTDPAARTEAPADTEPTTVDEVTVWALDYTGGTAGQASGEPIEIGYVNQEDLFPENTIGVAAAVEYVNAELGGASGRPLVIVPCTISSAPDGARCGAELAADPDIVAVVTGTILVGNVDLYDALEGVKPVIVGNGVTGDDLTTAAGHSFTAGSPGLIAGMAGFVAEELTGIDQVAVIGQDDPAGRAAAGLLFDPVMAEAGIETRYVGIDDTATAVEVRSAMDAAGADTADVLVPLVTTDQCVRVHEAAQTLTVVPLVIASGLCLGAAMVDHVTAIGGTGPVPDGWYLAGYGYNYFVPDDESGMRTYVTKVQEYGAPAPGASTLDYAGLAGPSFANVLTLTRFINQLGPESLDRAQFERVIGEFTGPMMLQVGPISCGDQVVLGLPIFVTLCASQIGIQQLVDGRWISVRDGLNGDPIDVSLL